MGFIAWILGTALPVVLGWFGFNKSAPSADEKVGKLETENESLRNYVSVDDRATVARDGVSDDPRVVYDDPDNRRQTPPADGKPGGT